MSVDRMRPERGHWAWVLCAFWVVIATILTAHHEPWRDEADGWLYARDAPWSWFFQGCRYTGTPTLWFLVQAPFARLGAPYELQRWLHLGIAVVGTTFFLRRAPLPLWARAAFAFSFFGLFEYAVVARSYALTLCGLWAACATWLERCRRPWFWVAVALLAQTNIPGMIFAGAFIAVAIAAPARVDATRPWRWWAWLGGAVVAYGLAIAQVWPPEDGQKEVEVVETAMASAVQRGLFPFGDGTLRAVCGGVVLGLIVLSLARNRLAAAFYAATFFGFSVLFQFVHTGALRHFGFLLVAFVVAAWLTGAEEQGAAPEAAPASPPPSSRASALALVLAVVCTPWLIEARYAVVDEIEKPFSNGQAMGRWMRSRGLHTRAVALASDAVSVTPWLAGPLFYPASRTSTSYMPWNSIQRANRGMGSTMLMHGSADFRRRHPGALLLTRAPLENHEKKGFRLLHAEANDRWHRFGEDLWLYELTPPRAPLAPISEVP